MKKRFASDKTRPTPETSRTNRMRTQRRFQPYKKNIYLDARRYCTHRLKNKDTSNASLDVPHLHIFCLFCFI
jgi:hypothetical protein